MDPTAQKRQRRGKRLFWLLATLTVLLPLGWLLYLTFGPNPPIVISKATTHITKPLDADGLPDYAAVLLARMRKGVTPENNGAVPLLQALWPKDYTSEQAKLVCDELKIPIPSTPLIAENFLTSESMYLAAEKIYRDRVFGSKELDSFEEFMLEENVYDLLDLAGRRPWSETDLPFAAEWITTHREGLDLLSEAANRPDWYLPDAGLLRGGSAALLRTEMEGKQSMSDAADYLNIQCNFAINRGDHRQAVRNALAILRLAQRASTSPFLTDFYLASSMSGIGHHAMDRVANDSRTPAPILRTTLISLDAIKPLTSIASYIDKGERFTNLDVAIAACELDPAFINHRRMESVAVTTLTRRTRINWNAALIEINRRHDRLVAAFKQPTPQRKRDAIRNSNLNLQTRYTVINNRDKILKLLLTPTRRAELTVVVSQLGDLADETLLNLVLNNVLSEQTNSQLARLHLALAIHRAEQGSYPETLNVLVPDILPELPVDPFNAKPYVYRRTDKGFLLYSLGLNGTDDGGSSEGFEGGGSGAQTYQGIEIDSMLDPTTDTLTPEEQAAYDLIEKIPAGADDLSLRVPLPVEPWPWEK